MQENQSLKSIPDDDLLRRLAALVGQSRCVEADIIAHIAEVDARKLYACAAFPSMFLYCRDALHLSEQQAYLRISVARASREHPILLAMLADGRLHLTAIGMLAPHLTRENRDGILERATHRSKRQLEELIAEIAPRPDVPAVVRKLSERTRRPTVDLLVVGTGPVVRRTPAPTLEPGPDPLRLGPERVAVPEPGASPPVSSPVVGSRMPPSAIEPLSPGRYKVQFMANAEFLRKLERLKALMGSRLANGDLAAVIEQAVTEKLERLEARRFARTRASLQGTPTTNPLRSSGSVLTETATEPSPDPTPSSRRIPAAVRRAVYQRDGSRCRYVDQQGRRCQERDRLEFHHRHPLGLGGEHSVANIRLMCPAHNAYLADCDYGRKAMDGHRRSKTRASSPPPG
jgi:hypothetical protein